MTFSKADAMAQNLKSLLHTSFIFEVLIPEQADLGPMQALSFAR